MFRIQWVVCVSDRASGHCSNTAISGYWSRLGWPCCQVLNKCLIDAVVVVQYITKHYSSFAVVSLCCRFYFIGRILFRRPFKAHLLDWVLQWCADELIRQLANVTYNCSCLLVCGREQRAMLASELEKNSDSFSPPETTRVPRTSPAVRVFEFVWRLEFACTKLKLIGSGMFQLFRHIYASCPTADLSRLFYMVKWKTKRKSKTTQDGGMLRARDHFFGLGLGLGLMKYWSWFDTLWSCLKSIFVLQV